MDWVLIFTILLVLTTGQEQRILRPVKDGVDAGIVFLPGALIQYNQYRLIAEQLQDATDFRLWVYLADGLVDSQEAAQASEETTIGYAKLQLQQAGMSPEAAFFSAGHSMGGRISQLEIDAYPDLVTAAFLLGSKFDFEYESFPVSVCTITGDLDGLNRMSTMAEVFKGVKTRVESGQPNYKYRYPMKVIEGTNHDPFVTGPSTDVVKEYDIDPEIEDEAARELIVEAMRHFMDYSTTEGDRSSLEDEIDAWFVETEAIMQPILEAFLMDENDEGISSWTLEAQRIVANLAEQDKQRLEVSNRVVDEDSLPGVRPDLTSAGGRVAVSTYVTVTYDLFATGLDYNSPFMLEAKMKNGDAIADGLNSPPGGYVSCKDVNIKAWEKIWKLVPTKNKERFEAKNIVVNFEEDDDAFSGPIWIWGELKFDFNGSKLDIQSVALWTDGEAGEEFGGMQYCKLLAPSRVIDFIYTDALRNYL